MTDDNDFEALKGEIERHDAAPADLAVVRKAELDGLRSDVDDLEDEVEAKESEIEEKEAEIEEKESEMEDLREEVSEAKSAYAEVLEEYTLADAEELMERYELGELREKMDDLDEEVSLASEPDVKGGSASGSGSSEPDDLSEDEKERFADFLAPGEGRLDGWRRMDRDDFEAELEARVEELRNAGGSSPIRERALEQHEEMLAELRGEE